MDIVRLLKDVPLEHLLLGVSTLLLISVFSSRASGRLGVPYLLLFLLTGMLAGSEGPGGIDFDYPRLAQSLGVIALVLILFSGGLDTHWQSVRRVLWSGIALSTLGVGVTAALVALFTVSLLHFSVLESLLLGAIVSSTDAAAVFAVLRSRGLRLPGDLKSLLELESGSNDPMAVLLTVELISVLADPSMSGLSMVQIFLRQIIVGALLGYSLGRSIAFLLSHLRLEYEGLYGVMTLAMALFTYAITTTVGGNGFLAVYLAGLMAAEAGGPQLDHIRRFHDGQAWLMQILMFLTLGLQVFPSHIVPIIGVGLVLSVFLMLVARPLAILVTLPFSEFTLTDKMVLAWGGLRGAVPIILATFPLIAGLPQAEMIFNLVFFIVVTSVLLQGTTLPIAARWAGISASEVEPARTVPSG